MLEYICVCVRVCMYTVNLLANAPWCIYKNREKEVGVVNSRQAAYFCEHLWI